MTGTFAPAGADRHYLPSDVLRAQALLLALVAAVYALAEAGHTGSPGSPLALLLAVLSGAVLGLTLSLLVHEWSHYAGARLAGGHILPVPRRRLFVFNWDFACNSPRQFMAMSYAGSAGSLLALILLALLLSPPSPAGTAAIAASAGSLVLVAVIEWPVLFRIHRGERPLQALQGIGRNTLLVAIAAGILAALLTAVWLNLPGIL